MCVFVSLDKFSYSWWPPSWTLSLNAGVCGKRPWAGPREPWPCIAVLCAGCPGKQRASPRVALRDPRASDVCFIEFPAWIKRGEQLKPGLDYKIYEIQNSPVASVSSFLFSDRLRAHVGENRKRAVGKLGSDSSCFWPESRWLFVHSSVFAERREPYGNRENCEWRASQCGAGLQREGIQKAAYGEESDFVFLVYSFLYYSDKWTEVQLPQSRYTRSKEKDSFGSVSGILRELFILFLF